MDRNRMIRRPEPDRAEIRKMYKNTTYGVPTTEEVIETSFPELRSILEAKPNYGVPPDPTQVYQGVYLGNVANAENQSLLRRLGITAILNCDGIPCLRSQRELRYTPDWGVSDYEEIYAEDGEFYDIVCHFPKAFRFIDASRLKGRVMIYGPDVNRSGAIALGYMVHRGIPLIRSAKVLKHARICALFNRGFMKQLIVYANDHRLLTGPERHHLQADVLQVIGRVRDKPRDSHLLQFI